MTRIEVTEEHIRTGKSASPSSCPVALAMRDAGFWAPCVGVHGVVADSKYMELPDAVVEWIKLYDCEGRMEPFFFELATKPEGVIE